METPKEKGYKLVDKYENLEFEKYDNENHQVNYYLSRNEAVECAKIAVEEIIDVLNGEYEAYYVREYWQEVKNELKNNT